MIYYIENTVSEYSSSIQGYFPTIESAIEAIAECADWWMPKGTGRIYETDFGLHAKKKLVWRDGKFVNGEF